MVRDRTRSRADSGDREPSLRCRAAGIPNTELVKGEVALRDPVACKGRRSKWSGRFVIDGFCSDGSSDAHIRASEAELPENAAFPCLFDIAFQ
jgi:hypothetical protein